MNRRAYLGACVGAGVAGVSGCLDAVAGNLTRTAATPAYLMPPVRGDDRAEWRSRPTQFVRPLDAELDSGNPALGTVRVRGWLTGSQLRATSHNASRSNRSSGLAAPDGDADADGVGDGTESTGGTRATDYNSSRSNTEGIRNDSGGDATGDGTNTTRATDYNSSRSNTEGSVIDDGGSGSDAGAQDYNSSRSNRPRTRSVGSDGDPDATGSRRVNNHNTTRSNRTQPVSGEGDGSDETVDLARAFEYLDADDDADGVVVGETFVVTAPVVDLPGVADPSARAERADYVTNMVTGARAASPTSEETVLRGLTTPTRIKELDKATPRLYTSTPADGADTLSGDWTPTTLAGSGDATDEHEPVVGRAVATLAGGVRLPVLVYAHHLVHGGDHLFVAGWVVDDARLYTTAATMLVAAGRTPVISLSPEQAAAPDAPSMRALGVNERDQYGSLVYDAGTDQPDQAVAMRAARLCGGAGCPATGDDSLAGRARAALRPDPETPPASADEAISLLAVPIDAPLVHLSGSRIADEEAVTSGIVHTDAWEA